MCRSSIPSLQKQFWRAADRFPSSGCWTTGAGHVAGSYGTAPLQYKFFRRDESGVWTVPQDYSP
jgi:hypothetical protein